MAPPGKRRAGFSRKAHYGLFAGYVIAVAGALLGLLLVITARLDPMGSNAIRAALVDATSPVSNGMRTIVRGGGALGTAVSDYIAAGTQNAALRKERDASRRKLIEARALAYENARLKRLLGIAEISGDAVATGRLTSSSSSSTRRFAILDKGSASGVLLGQPVRGPDGLVGRIVETGLVTARIQLIVDAGTVVPVIRVQDGLAALATGGGDGLLDIRSVSPGGNRFKPGDVFMTSGTGGVYPPRVPVGIAIRSDGESATARPLANPGQLDYAIVLPIFRAEAAAPPPALEPPAL